MAGRPTKYTPERVKMITDALKVGATQRLACQYAGVSTDSFARWVEKYADFAEAIKEAEGRAAVGWLAKIEKEASDGTWQAAAWKLERLYPAEYGRTVVDQRHSGSITIERAARMTEDEIDAEMAKRGLL
jgi:hypothetical protein